MDIDEQEAAPKFDALHFPCRKETSDLFVHFGPACVFCCKKRLSNKWAGQTQIYAYMSFLKGICIHEFE